LEGEKRAAIKKAKSTKGKKSKDAVVAVEEEYALRLKELEANHALHLARIGEDLDTRSTQDRAEEMPAAEDETQESAKDRKQEKARRKKERQKERELQREKEIEEEAANAGPSLRTVELEQLQNVLTPLNFLIAEVEADGHCLYRAVGAQTGRDYIHVRALCADTLESHEEDFAPFCEFSEEVTTFKQYVDRVRNSAEWGGHLELRVLGMALDRPVEVYSVPSGREPLVIHESDNEPIRLSYHLHYYALGEHYNQVVEKE